MLKGFSMKSLVAGMALFGLFAANNVSVELAQSDQCVQQCRADHNQCRIKTKGSPSCDSQLQACMDSCRARQ